MTRLACVAAWMGLAAVAWGGGLPPVKHCTHCIVPPPPPCPDCGDPCAKRHCLLLPWQAGKAAHLIADLEHGDCCHARVKAAGKLGCCLHADFCSQPEVLPALIHALHCDPCWEVRKEAAWSICLQKARVYQAVFALYLSSKLDPHFLVRTKAAESLDILLVGGRRQCFKELFDATDELIKQLKGKYKPGTENCAVLLADFCAGRPVPPR